MSLTAQNHSKTNALRFLYSETSAISIAKTLRSYIRLCSYCFTSLCIEQNIVNKMLIYLLICD